MWTYIGAIADDHFFVPLVTGTNEIQVYLRSAHGGCGANGAIGYSNLCKESRRNDSTLLISSIGSDFKEKQEQFGNKSRYDILESKKPHLDIILYDSDNPTTSFDVILKPPNGKQISTATFDAITKWGYYTQELTKQLFNVPMRLRKRVEREVCEWAQIYKGKPGSMKDLEDYVIVTDLLRNNLPRFSEYLKKISIVGGTLEMHKVVIEALRSLPSTKESIIHYTPGPAIYSTMSTPFVSMSRDDFIRNILTKVDILQLNKPERYHLMGGRSSAIYDLLTDKPLKNARLKIVLCTSRRYMSDYCQKSSELCSKALDATAGGIGHVHDFLKQKQELGIDISTYRPNRERIEKITKRVKRIEKKEIDGIERIDFLTPEVIRGQSSVGLGDAFGSGFDFYLSPEIEGIQ